MISKRQISTAVVLALGVVAYPNAPGMPQNGWYGHIQCRRVVTGPLSYHHDETQRWNVLGAPQVSGGGTVYPVKWIAKGSGGGTGKSWVIDKQATTDLSVSVLANGNTTFDRTTAPIHISRGIAGVPVSFDLDEINFPPIVKTSPLAKSQSVSGTWSRPTSAGDSPQQPGGSSGTVSCTWSLNYQVSRLRSRDTTAAP